MLTQERIVSESIQVDPLRNGNIADGQVVLFEQYRLLRKAWLWVLIVALLATGAMAYYAYYVVVPDYKATVVALPTNKSGTPLDNIFGSIAASLKDAALGKLVGKQGMENGYTRLSIMTSRTVFDSLIAKHDLYRIYQIPVNRPDLIYARIAENVEIEPQLEGPINVSVFDPDPQRAAVMATDIVEITNWLSKDLNRRETEPITAYVYKRYHDVREQQDSVNIALESFLRTNKIYDPESQSGIIGSAIQKSESKIGETRARIKILTEQLGADDPQTILERQILAGLEQQSRGLAQGNLGVIQGAQLSKLPTAAVQYLNLKAEFEINAKLLAILQPIYEQMKMEEARNIPVINILDQAYVPPVKARPRRSILVGSAFLGTFILCYLVLSLTTYVRSFQHRYRKYIAGNHAAGTDSFQPIKELR